MKTTWILAGLLIAGLNQEITDPRGQRDSTDLLLTQQVINTLFSETTPDFNDMYMIRSEDKVRQIRVYCNPTSCYKVRNFRMHS